jgi:hypothetical protein
MSMTKKDYEGIAAAIAYAADADREPLRIAAIETVAHCIASYCANTNPSFKRARFIAACGLAVVTATAEAHDSHHAHRHHVHHGATVQAPADVRMTMPAHAKHEAIVPGGALVRNTLVWRYLPAGEPAFVAGQMPALIARAMQEWADVCPVRFYYAGTSQREQAWDGYSTIGWTKPNTLPPGLAGYADVSYRYSVKEVVIGESDIRLDPARIVDAGDVYRLVLHEVGHAIGIAHSDIEGALMSGPPHSGYTYHASLQADDIAGCRSLYGSK